MTIDTILNNYSHLFKSSISLKVIKNYTRTTDSTLECIGQVKGLTGIYNVNLQVQPDKQGKYSVRSECKFDCSCPAYRYYVNEPLYRAGNAMQLVAHWMPKKTNRVNNPKHVATICKHLYAYVIYLIQKGILQK